MPDLKTITNINDNDNGDLDKLDDNKDSYPVAGSGIHRHLHSADEKDSSSEDAPNTSNEAESDNDEDKASGNAEDGPTSDTDGKDNEDNDCSSGNGGALASNGSGTADNIDDAARNKAAEGNHHDEDLVNEAETAESSAYQWPGGSACLFPGPIGPGGDDWGTASSDASTILADTNLDPVGSSAKTQEECMRAVLVAVTKSRIKPNGHLNYPLHVVAKDYGVPWSTLTDCYHGKQTHQEAPVHECKLLASQDEVLVEWTKELGWRES
ncbi:uncharacterized protein C8Q71DRAFT_727123 [Rhodofomes roseus]|uniref:Uncharacterized protein n=1 Tax=Rhodofomes roseus TaxID=34475 RepID=A0ABQ8K312_9APHY|nr:uncharacterized protein C8Q71DRAFT_727123 [Rhodofomes roseus]KAH9830931.1 hypothetical protein C8Q71DRAFT_727123 [Rhodofomes roseus]